MDLNILPRFETLQDLRKEVYRSVISKTKISHFAWCLLFQGLPLGLQLKHIRVPDPRCPFCGQPKSFLYIFYFFRHAQNYQHQIHDFFKPFRPEPFSWHMVVVGDSSQIPWKFTQIQHTFRMDIFFTLWKDRNFVLFTHIFLDINVVMCTKTCICNNVMMQIQVQEKKVALEVAHLQEILNHWGNAPCIVAKVPLDASVDMPPLRGHRLGHSSLGS